MVQFNRITGMDPDRFLAWAKTVDSLDVSDQIAKAADSIPGSGARFNFKTDMRSFLVHNGYRDLPKSDGAYTLQEWHRAYKKEELRRILGYLDTPVHKLFLLIAAETGLRADTVRTLCYRHVREDLEAGLVPVAVRLEPKYYGRKKSAGFTFLGDRSIALLNECIQQGIIKKQVDWPLIPSMKRPREGEPRIWVDKPLSYSNLYEVLVRASEKAGIKDPRIMPNHSIRKYFEDCLDQAGIDHEKKMVLEGHFGDTRSKHYTSREWEELRPLYWKAYPFIDPERDSVEVAVKLQSWEDEKKDMKREISELRTLVESLLKEKRSN
jgi:integrase